VVPRANFEWLRATFPDESAMHVSHETLYQTLYLQARGALKRELIAHLRERRHNCRARATPRDTERVQLDDIISISERPPTVEDCAVPGHCGE
jgi:IS30 family transposase